MRAYEDISKEVRGKRACSHTKTERRNKQDKNGRPRIGDQCLQCGMMVGNVQSSKTLSPEVIQKLPLWDNQLGQTYSISIYKEIENLVEAEKAKDNAVRQKEYEVYLQSDKWKRIRSKVLARAKGTCEGCGINKATEVHHLNYDRVKDEMLFDLVAVCGECHTKIHQKNILPQEEILEYEDIEASHDTDESLPF